MLVTTNVFFQSFLFVCCLKRSKQVMQKSINLVINLHRISLSTYECDKGLGTV